MRSVGVLLIRRVRHALFVVTFSMTGMRAGDLRYVIYNVDVVVDRLVAISTG